MYTYKEILFENLIMHHEAILYSLDPKLPFSQIQNSVEYTTNNYAKLQHWMTENGI